MAGDQTETQETVGRATCPGGFCVPTPPTLQKRAQFLAAARGQRVVMRGFILQAIPRQPLDGDPARVGYTCSKKVGNAVTRNRAKRRLRALAREVIAPCGATGWDYVLVGRAGETVARAYADMRQDLLHALDRLHGNAA